MGYKAEYYKQNQDELSHKKLLRNFGAQESLADEMLTDKGILLLNKKHIICIFEAKYNFHNNFEISFYLIIPICI